MSMVLLYLSVVSINSLFRMLKDIDFYSKITFTIRTNLINNISSETIQHIAFDKSSRNEILDKLGELVERCIAESERKQRYEFSKRKWRYCILQYLANSNLDFYSMFEQVYALFGYPEDMLNFIPYMPPQDNYKPILHTNMKNQTRLLNNLSVFLNTEKNFFKDRQAKLYIY
ncbi:MAG: DUF2247 family protein [Oscillospiraceae bacterium]